MQLKRLNNNESGQSRCMHVVPMIYGDILKVSCLFHEYRVPDVARLCDRRSPKGQGLLRKEGPPTYALLQNLVLSHRVKTNVFVAKICKYALDESSEGLFCGRRKPANPWHTA